MSKKSGLQLMVAHLPDSTRVKYCDHLFVMIAAQNLDLDSDDLAYLMFLAEYKLWPDAFPEGKRWHVIWTEVKQEFIQRARDIRAAYGHTIADPVRLTNEQRLDLILTQENMVHLLNQLSKRQSASV